MSGPFIFINTYAIREGKLEDYKRLFKEVVDLVAEKQPRILFFANYINDEGTEATTLQVHPDPESMEYHMEIAGEHIRAATAFLDFSQMHMQVYGIPNEAVLEQMRQLAGSGVPVSIKKPDAVVDRLPLSAG